MASGYDHGGGGGFYADGMTSTQSPATKKARQTVQTITPITLKQVAAAVEKNDSTFVLNDFELSLVTFVACIRKMSSRTTQSAYLMEDGTASVDVRRFHAQKVDGQDNSMDEAVDSNGEDGLSEGQYVRVYGQVRSFSSKIHINASSVRPIEDFNEITFHMLEVMHVTLKRQNANQFVSFVGKPPPNAVMGGGALNNQQFGNSAYYNQQQHHSGGYIQDGSSHFTPVQQRVIDLVQSRGDETDLGVHIDELARIMSHDGFSDYQIRQEVKSLMNEGVIYSTDDFHFKVV